MRYLPIPLALWLIGCGACRPAPAPRPDPVIREIVAVSFGADQVGQAQDAVGAANGLLGLFDAPADAGGDRE